jgi:mono/diheme cytochrome c family protein
LPTLSGRVPRAGCAYARSGEFDERELVLQGHAGRSVLAPGFMPAFGEAYSDEEVAAVANYVIARFDARPSHITPAQVAALRRQSG